MIRKIIRIDEELCNGCGACATACHEGAIEMVGGKAKLTREDYCDGLGDCLPGCPTGAITFEHREAPAYDEAAVLAAKQKKSGKSEAAVKHTGCPGTRLHKMQRVTEEDVPNIRLHSELGQWPCQMKLVPVNAPYFQGADLLIAADCTAYAYANMHGDFMKGKITLIGCPKLDQIDYSEKLTQVICENQIQSVTVVIMEVPCCGGLRQAVQKALQASGKHIPYSVVTITLDGNRIETDV